jgi:hypothetical protein
MAAPGYANQPTKKLTKGGVLHKRQTSSLARFDHSCLRNALLEMVEGASNYNGGCAYAKGNVALTSSHKGLLLLVGDCPIRQRVLCKNNFCWMALWGLNPEFLGSLWLMASATWGDITSAEDLHDWGRRAVPLLNYTLAFEL